MIKLSAYYMLIVFLVVAFARLVHELAKLLQVCRNNSTNSSKSNGYCKLL